MFWVKFKVLLGKVGELRITFLHYRAYVLFVNKKNVKLNRVP
jgi:hypothetical protein